MYLFYADRLGRILMGSDGQMSVPKAIKTNSALIKLAIKFLGKRIGKIYLMEKWTQEMCELGPYEFEEYIAKHGKVLISC